MKRIRAGLISTEPIAAKIPKSQKADRVEMMGGEYYCIVLKGAQRGNSQDKLSLLGGPFHPASLLSI
jgi:hypothetical protein